MKLLLCLILLFCLSAASVYAESGIADYREYLSKDYQEIESRVNQFKPGAVKELSVKIVKEAYSKKIEPGRILLFFIAQSDNLLKLEKLAEQFAVKDSGQIENFFLLIREQFTDNFILSLLKEIRGKNFENRFSKTMIFVVYYINHITEKTLQKQHAEQIASAVFRADPEQTYLIRLINLLVALKEKNLDSAKVAAVFVRAFTEKTPVRKIEDRLKELE